MAKNGGFLNSPRQEKIFGTNKQNSLSYLIFLTKLCAKVARTLPTSQAKMVFRFVLISSSGASSIYRRN